MDTFAYKMRNIAIIFLLSISTLISYYLYSKSPLVASCVAGSSCDKVTTSSYANVIGIPITLIGCLTYIALVFCLLFSTKRPIFRIIGTFLSFSIILGAIWFFAVQLFIIKEFCYYCCAIHTFAIIASILFVTKHSSSQLRKTVVASFALAVCSVTSMALIQSVYPHTLNKTKSSTIASLSLNTDNLLALYDDAIKIDLNELPTFTPNNQEKASLLLSDFTCPHCLSLTYSLLYAAENELDGLSIYFLPVYQQPNSKEINRIMILLQRIDPDLFKSTVLALHDQQIPLNFNDIKSHIEKNLSGDFRTYYDGYYRWSEKLLTTGNQLAELNQINARVSGFPQFMIANRIIEGQISIESINALADSTNTKELTAFVSEKNKSINSKTSALSIFPAQTKLGRIIKNQSKHDSFTLINNSSEPIEIEKWNVSCGCIQLKETPSIVPAKSKIDVHYEFDTKKFIGNVIHRVFIYEKDVEKPHALDIGAYVWMPVKILPFKTNFGNLVKGGQSAVQRTTILNNTLQPVYVKLGDYDKDLMKVSLKEMLPGQHYELESQIINAPGENIESSINIQTSNKDCSTIDLPIISQNAGLYTLKPNTITSSEIKKDGKISIVIYCNDNSLELKKQFKSITYIGTQKTLVKFKLQSSPNTHTMFTFKVDFDKNYDFKKALLSKDYFEFSFKDPKLNTLRIYLSE